MNYKREIKLSVIIATYNRAKSLKKCLDSLVKQSLKDFELIIIDGGSKDKTDDVLASYFNKLNIKKLIYPYFELAEVRDFGWRNSNGKYLAWIDDDVILSENWAKEAIDILEKDKKIGGISGPTIIYSKLRRQRDVFSLVNKDGWLARIWKNYFLEGDYKAVGKIFRSGAWSPGSNFEDCLSIDKLLEVDYLEACNMFLRRELVEKIGGFDLRYRGTAEWCELDLAFRIKKLGYKLVFSSKVKLEHYVSQSGVFENRVKAKQRMENFFQFYFTHIFKFKIDYIIRFVSYVFFLDGYWIYKFIKSGDIRWLSGVTGNISGIKNYLFQNKNN